MSCLGFTVWMRLFSLHTKRWTDTILTWSIFVFSDIFVTRVCYRTGGLKRPLCQAKTRLVQVVYHLFNTCCLSQVTETGLVSPRTSGCDSCFSFSCDGRLAEAQGKQQDEVFDIMSSVLSSHRFMRVVFAWGKQVRWLGVSNPLSFVWQHDSASCIRLPCIHSWMDHFMFPVMPRQSWRTCRLHRVC